MPDRIAEHYERHAHAFDAARRRDFVEKDWLDRFLAAIPKGQHILDLGCGAGEPVARHLIDTGHELTGIDLSERMIALCRTRFPRHRWLCADMRRVIMDRKFGGVLAWDSLFHLPHDDQRAMIERVAGWLDPGGGFLFNAGPARGEATGSQFGEDIYHASLAPYEYRALFDELGLIEIAFVPDDPHTGGRSVWFVCKGH